jgi:hypothetical protein
MPRIRVILFQEAKGALKREYDAALKRAGRIWNIVSIMSQNPRAIHDATQIVAYFNTINRVADALGVENEAFIRSWEEVDRAGL